MVKPSWHPASENTEQYQRAASETRHGTALA